MTASPWFNFAVALALGLLIGLERERTKGEGPTRRAAGIRTFALATLLGALAAHLGGAVLLAVATAAVAVLTALSYVRIHDADPGMTTEVGLVAAPLLGGVAMSDPLLASGLSVAVAVVFAAKAPLHSFTRDVLTAAEVKDGLVFAIATLVIWPLLPDRYMGPLQALNPHTVWLLVVLMLAIGACGHITTRALGARYGLPVAGLASGFVSSTATIGSMAGRAAKEPTIMRAAVAGAALSTVATFLQMALVLLALDRPKLVLMTPALAAGGAAAALYGLGFTVWALQSNDVAASKPGRAFSIKATLGLAATMVVMLVTAAALKDWLGEAGIVTGAALAGLVDTHSAAISVASLAAAGKLAPQDAVVPVLAAMTSNALAKIVMAVAAGSGGFAMRIVPGLVLSMAVAWAAAAVMVLG
jgi:uncharacterized membrane protein (DUF4010 family)